MHVRLQTWLPFPMHVVLNGRGRLARQLTAAGIGYTQRDNRFTDLADPQWVARRRLRSRFKTP
jgi:hypothetical protein